MKAFFGSSKSDSVNRDTAFYHLKAAKCCKSLTENQQKEFGHSIRMGNQKQMFHATRAVLVYTDINRYYIKGVGSIMKNISIPEPIIEYEHAYISLVSAVDHY